VLPTRLIFPCLPKVGRLLGACFFLPWIFLSSAAWATSDDAAILVAVSPFENNSEKAEYAALRKGLPDMLTTDLTASSQIRLVERARLNDVLGELDLQKSDFFDPSTASQLGHGLGAEFIVTGSFTVFSDTLRIDARLVDVETAEIILSKSSEGPTSTWSKLARELATEILKGLGEELSPLAKKKMKIGDSDSFDALVSYSNSLEHVDAGRVAEAEAALRSALKADPDFTKARASLDKVLSNIRAAEDTLALAAEGFGKTLTELIAAHQGGSTEACGQIVQLVMDEVMRIRTWENSNTFGAMSIMAPMPGAPENAGEAGQKIYQLMHFSKVLGQQDLRTGSTQLGGSKVTCNPETVLVSYTIQLLQSTVENTLNYRDGIGTVGPFTAGGTLPVNSKGKKLSEDDVLEVFVGLGNRLLELDPRAAQPWLPTIRRAADGLELQRRDRAME
jgi:TolB-like protein